MAFTPNAIVLTQHLDTAEKRIKREIAKAVAGGLSHAFQSVAIANGKVQFYAKTDKSGDVIGEFDLPEELYLDQAVTTIVDNFVWSAATYPGSINPNLNGKAVLVLGVKGDRATNPTVKYSFVNLTKLIDVYTAGDNTININGYTVTVKISAAADNLLEVKADGLFVGSDDSKLDKVPTAVSGHFAMWSASGVLIDSGHGVATDADIAAMLAENFGEEGEVG